MENVEVQEIKFNHRSLLGPFPGESKLQTKIVFRRLQKGGV